ncbi:MAG: YdcF family protein [Actinomycetota bacterium]|nr:YdcF family protein [Actinomycetota bacterium]
MREAAPPVVPDSLLGELRALVRVYRGESVFAEGSAEAAVVLGAQVLRGGRPSGTLQARARHAAQLYKEGEVALVIPTGGVGDYPPSEAEVAARVMREVGVSGEDILLEEEALSTRDSARFVAEVARARGIRSLVLVTDPLHCVRSVGAFRAEGFEAWTSPVYSSPMWRKPWLRRGQLFRETVAVVWYRIRRRRVRLRSRP